MGSAIHNLPSAELDSARISRPSRLIARTVVRSPLYPPSGVRPGAHDPLAPFEDRGVSPVVSSHLGRVRLDPLTAGPCTTRPSAPATVVLPSVAGGPLYGFTSQSRR